MNVYKILVRTEDNELRTVHPMIWNAPGINKIPKKDRRTQLCSPGLLHAYDASKGLEMALYNDMVYHMEYTYVYLPTQFTNRWEVWLGEGTPVVEDERKVGFHEITLIEPVLTYKDIDPKVYICNYHKPNNLKGILKQCA